MAQAQRRVSYTEFLLWSQYRQRRGSLNTGMRVERAGALIATILANQNRKSDSQPFSFYSLAPHHDEPVLTMEEAMESWK
ncbi:MAG: hypothetical protein CMG91_04730 [Marinobacter sp.]|nr:hypothetical protein [Marinobacter sp.]MBP55384.1 hypothetical protein [Marinobacter sp.]